MGILILLTIFLIVAQLGRLLLQEARICPFDSEQIAIVANIKNNLPDHFLLWPVKLILKSHYLLNTVTLTNQQKDTLTTLIQLKNLKFEG